MNRFQKPHPLRAALRRLWPVLVFLAILFGFAQGFGALAGMSDREEAQTLAASVRRSAVHCYALEGFYPDSLAYLEAHYGLHYDKDRYIVAYETVGSNLIPDITVIDRRA